MNQQDAKADQGQIESIKDLELTSEQAEETKAGIKMENCLVSSYSFSSGGDRPTE